MGWYALGFAATWIWLNASKLNYQL